MSKSQKRRNYLVKTKLKTRLKVSKKHKQLAKVKLFRSNGIVSRMSKKETKQYNELLRYGVNVTGKRFHEYYTNLRKANRKGYRLKKDTSYIGNIPHYSLNVTPRNLEEFTRYERTLSKIVKRNYRSRQQSKTYNRFKKNLKDVFGSKANDLIKRFNSLSENNKKEFFEKNKDLEVIRWGSAGAVEKVINLLDMTLEKLESRLDLIERK